jgi:hypothetical protein
MMGTLAVGLPRKSPLTDLLPLEYLVVAEPPVRYTAITPPDAVIMDKIHLVRGAKGHVG